MTGPTVRRRRATPACQWLHWQAGSTRGRHPASISCRLHGWRRPLVAARRPGRPALPIGESVKRGPIWSRALHARPAGAPDASGQPDPLERRTLDAREEALLHVRALVAAQAFQLQARALDVLAGDL